MKNFKNIHLGELIRARVKEKGLEAGRICSFIKCTEAELSEIYGCKSLDSEQILRWSKLLDYDFFRIYSQHLILYSPPAAYNPDESLKMEKSSLPQFRKNIYTTEIINFILESIDTGEKTKQEVMEHYGIPKTTLYKWISKRK
ncbi:transposase [uncultured Chryseobacterium sp.]|uniref:transposase n=1 Tax=uncultured Chryseobacterium sp. TaxID=259322 RepID=UPI0025EE1660|nr:transposase [uncultured Chryseobacterium sp.]